MTKQARQFYLRDSLYRVHVATALIAALWLLLIAVTGVLINHQDSLGLTEMEISDRYLPSYYRADVRTGATRLNIIITDLHSGRIFGSSGHLIGDVVALLIVVSIFSGFVSYRSKKKLGSSAGRRENGSSSDALKRAHPARKGAAAVADFELSDEQAPDGTNGAGKISFSQETPPKETSGKH